MALAISGMMALLSSACNGIFSDIYDDPSDNPHSGYGFLTPSADTAPGTIYIDATDYGTWTYIDLHGMTAEELPVTEPAPRDWDIAVHRYDARTNGGAVAVTDATGFGTLHDFLPVAEDLYVEDVWTTETIITDMSTMIDGYLGYAASFYNPELSKWLDVDKSTMPPVYTPSHRVYVVRLSDGTIAALRLGDYMDSAGVKGYLTIEYVYPLTE